MCSRAERHPHLKAQLLDDIELNIPFLGALLENEKDSEALEKYHDRGGRYSSLGRFYHLVERIFPMFQLSVDGIGDAACALIGARVAHSGPDGRPRGAGLPFRSPGVAEWHRRQLLGGLEGGSHACGS